MQETKGFNPFKLGFVGATDTHNAATPAPATEEHYFGKVGRNGRHRRGLRGSDAAEAASADLGRRCNYREALLRRAATSSGAPLVITGGVGRAERRASSHIRRLPPQARRSPPPARECGCASSPATSFPRPTY